MLRVLMLLVPLAVGIYAFIDCLTTPEEEVRSLPKLVWVFVILLFWPLFLGPIGWFVAGRPQRELVGGHPGGRRSSAPLAPDDDPEFLASLRKSNEDDAELLKKWEEDLRRREGEQQGEDDKDGPKG